LTPTSSEEFEFAQAGLGKRHLTMLKDMNHDEIFELLQIEYPKMKGLTGGWLLYKATGGQGRRRLIMIPPDSNGYTGSLIRSVTGAGKSILYIVPLQHEFDLTPLPPDAIEFQRMPKAQCQTCKVSFPLQILALHVQESGFKKVFLYSVDDILDTISRRVDHEKQFHIQISRTNILERGLLQWQRQKKNLPTAALKVTFFGEAGVDTGALRKEFLTEMVAGIEDRFFEGTQNKKSPRYSLTDFDNGMYRTVGEILAVSLAQGGPAPTFFSPWSYYYLCNGQINPTTLNSDAVADVHLRGAVILHAVLRLQPMLEQLREGLQLYDLLSLLRQYPDICQPLLVPGEDFVMASICPQLSDKGSTRHQIELELINFLQDFLYEAEEGPHSITPARFLQWVTGQGHIPLLPSEKKDFAVTVKFNHDCNADFGIHNICYPVVSACAKRIVLPVRHIKSYDQFKSILLEAFYLGQEFNIV
uniref:HECT domain-containing protein n=1 Tax=Astyanax mexicanus TaxID=7994 RepID=A0A3B1J5C8_ASTMX